MPETTAPDIRKAYDARTDLVDGAREIIATITTRTVDRDGDVVLAKGLDLTNFRKNPVVMFAHKYDELPVGKALWIKPTADGSGLVAKVQFAKHQFAEDIYQCYHDGILSGFSVGIIRPESGRPSAAEKATMPDLAKAQSVIRRGELVEFSVAPIPVNPDALTIAKSLKSPQIFDYLTSKALNESSGAAGGYTVPPEQETEDDDDDEAAEKVFDPDQDGDDDSSPETDTDHDQGRPDDAAADDEAADDEDEDGDKPKTKACTPDADESRPPIKAGHYVEWGKGMKAGCGKVLSIHKGGKVPGVAEEIEGTEDDPAAKVKCYKCADDGKWRPGAKCMGHKCAALSLVPHPLDDEDEEPKAKAIVLPKCRTLADLTREITSRLEAIDLPALARARADEAAYVARGGI